VVEASVGGHVRRVYRDGRQLQPPRDRATAGAQDERAGQVDQLGAVRGHRHPDPRPGHADPEAGVAGHSQRRNPYHRVVERGIGMRPPAGRLGRNDQGLVTAVDQVLCDADRGVRDAIDIGGEGLGDICDSHDYYG